MARTVDPVRHQARRLQILDAALTCFAAHGYERTTTALICRTAGIGSGTFFHYFPTKADVLTSIVTHGTEETRAFFATHEGDADARSVIAAYVEHFLADASDARLPGFVTMVAARMTDPAVAEVLAADEAAVAAGLQAWVRAAQDAADVRRDVDAARLTRWVVLLLDGFLGRVVADPGFAVDAEADMLRQLVDRLLEPGAADPAGRTRHRPGAPSSTPGR